MRAFFNIIIIGLIGLCSSTYLFNLSPIDYRGMIEIETPVEESTLTLEIVEDEILNPESVTIKHTASKDEVVKIITPSIFNVDIYLDNQLIKGNISDLEMFSPSIDANISISEDKPLITNLNLNQDKLNLEDGTYKFVFNSNLIADEDQSSLSITVIYRIEGNYYPATKEAPIGTKGLTLYFPTENADTLIPITRFVVEDKSITRMAIEQLQNGPLDEGLTTVIKDVTNTTYNNGNVVIDLPSSYEGYNSASRVGNMAYESFIKTIFAVDRYWPIYSLTFTVDRTRVETYFHGIDISPVANVGENYLLYLAHRSGDRYYLFQHKVYPEQIGIIEGDPIEIQVEKLFDAYYDTDLIYAISPIPKGIALNNIRVDGRILQLDFNREFLNIYEENIDLRYMVVESLIYTFTSIPGIEGIELSVEGEEIVDFIDTDLATRLYPAEFINPEIIDSQQEGE